ncbi:MAG: tetratricopeptide repeat protein [Bacteroidota bacterium]
MLVNKSYYNKLIASIFSLIFLCLSYSVTANEGDTVVLNSLFERYLDSNNDSVKVYFLVKLAENLESNNVINYHKKTIDEYLQQANSITNDSISINSLAFILDSIGVKFRNDGKYISSLKFHNWAKDITFRISNKNQQSIIFNNIGVVYRRLDDYQTALSNHIQALHLAEEINNIKSQAVAINSMGNIQMMIGNLDESLEYFKQSLLLEQKQNSLLGIAINLNNIGNVYSIKANFSKALEYYFLSLDINKEIKSKKGIAICYNDIGNIYERLGKYDKSLIYYLDALAINRQLNDKHGLANSYLQVGELYADIQQNKTALEYLNPGLKISLEIGTKTFIMDAYLALYKISRASKQYEEAFNYLQLSNLYHDSIININVKKNIARLKIKFESEQKENQIELLKQNAHISDLVIKRQKTLNWLMFTAIIIALGIMISLLYYVFNNNKTNKLLLERNKIIEKTKAELDRYSKELLVAKREAEENNRAKGEFLANMSHEIRTPLNSVIGFTELLSTSSVDPQQLNNLKIIKSSSRTLLTIINDILDLSKIEAGKLTFEYENIKIEQIIIDVVQMFSHSANEKNIKLITDFQYGLPQTIILNEFRFRQILFNLIGNAISYTNNGNISIEVHYKPSTSDNKINLTINVTDTGIGIKVDELQNIFEPFNQVDINKTNKGTGLGLTITKNIVEMMNGTINVSSILNKGTTFSINFYDIVIVNELLIDKQNIPSVVVGNKSEESSNDYFYDLAMNKANPKFEEDLSEIYTKFFKTALETKMLNNISTFITVLSKLAHKYKSDGLIKYCSDLNNNVSNFDIEKIDKLLKLFDTNYLLKK